MLQGGFELTSSYQCSDLHDKLLGYDAKLKNLTLEKKLECKWNILPRSAIVLLHASL